MDQTAQDFWEKFECWKKQYQSVFHKLIEEIMSCGYSDFDGGFCFRKWHELNQDLVLDLNVSESELSNRIIDKIQFIKGYLVDIYFDGPDFADKYYNFLEFQCPSKCDNAIGIWLEQDLEGEVEAGSYFGFQGFDMNIFCRSVDDIDLASMRNILPFDRMYLRQPKGKIWDEQSIRSVVQQVKEDIEFDYEVIVTPSNKSEELLSINFIFN
ncbi:MAG: hypothetical protein IBX50_12825 [Marinospirillum sp.]|uniref:hypothetical protein n=1 Tax=Marinospirillum sp. TaxID=2183934 RepID=UPI0019EEA4CF|nr:hypothetical protein [Marinospirillum sp.]MBE0507576.1 hypothetical protein [Marinospirillum sp.]